MNLLQAIHQRWAFHRGPGRPLAGGPGLYRHERRSHPALCRARQGKPAPRRVLQRRFRDRGVGLPIQVFHGQYDAARPSCSRSKWPSTAPISPWPAAISSFHMRRVNDSERQSEDGVWQFSRDYQCTVYLAAGV